MTATMATATGMDKSGRQKEATRLGNFAAQAQAQTYHTFASCMVFADGSGYIMVQRDGKTLHMFEFEAEGKLKEQTNGPTG